MCIAAMASHYASSIAKISHHQHLQICIAVLVQSSQLQYRCGGTAGELLSFGRHTQVTLAPKTKILNMLGFDCFAKTVVNAGSHIAANVWLLMGLKISISIIPVRGHRIPVSTSVMSKIPCLLSSSQWSLPILFRNSISMSWLILICFIAICKIVVLCT